MIPPVEPFTDRDLRYEMQHFHIERAIEDPRSDYEILVALGRIPIAKLPSTD